MSMMQIAHMVSFVCPEDMKLRELKVPMKIYMISMKV